MRLNLNLQFISAHLGSFQSHVYEAAIRGDKATVKIYEAQEIKSFKMCCHKTFDFRRASIENWKIKHSMRVRKCAPEYRQLNVHALIYASIKVKIRALEF